MWLLSLIDYYFSGAWIKWALLAAFFMWLGKKIL